MPTRKETVPQNVRVCRVAKEIELLGPMGSIDSIHCRVSYRPVRLGWCVRDGSLEDVRKAIRYACCLWGGSFNPIVVVGSANARDVIASFGVDALQPMTDDPEIRKFVSNTSHLPWPLFQEGVFAGRDTGRRAQFLDLQQVVHRMEELKSKKLVQPDWKITLVDSETGDPLADVISATFGSLPTADEVGFDYRAFLDERIGVDQVLLPPDAPIPKELHKAFNLVDLLESELTPDSRSASSGAAVYVLWTR